MMSLKLESPNIYDLLEPDAKAILEKILVPNRRMETLSKLSRCTSESVEIFLNLIQETHRLGFDWYFLDFTKNNKSTLRCAKKELVSKQAENDSVLFDVTIAPRGISCFFWQGRVQKNKQYLRPIKLTKKQESINVTDKRITSLIAGLRGIKEKVQNREGYFPIDYGYQKSSSKNTETQSRVEDSKILAKNVIFYGPPGTGKTHAFKEKITELKENVERNTKPKQLTWLDAILEVFKRYPEGLTVPKLMLESPLKEKAQQVKNKEVYRRVLWGILQAHTVLDCENVKAVNRVGDLVFVKSDDSVWNLTKEARQRLWKRKNKNSEPENPKRRYEFVTFHQSYSYEDFVEGIRPVLDKKKSSSISYELKDGIFKELCLRAQDDPENEYVIFIDEINRGNISKIFGELITLIELDKRKNIYSDEECEWEVRLPYSRELFSVPSNVSIYATMNTADHSLTRIDAALRRRFDFQYFPPQAKLLTNTISFGNSKVPLSNFLLKINSEITKFMGDSDHCVGHGYFWNVESKEDFLQVIKEKIHPLLQSYFFDEPEKLKEILGALVRDDGELNMDVLEKEESYKKWALPSENSKE